MEYRAADSGGTTSRKSRSLDLQSLYKSTVSVQQGDKKKRTNEVLDDGRVRKKKRKRKSRREVSVNSLEPAGQTCRISLDETGGDSTSSDSLNSGKLHSWLSGDFGTITGLSSISLNLDGGGGGNVIQIPKRRRGFVGRKRVESVKVSRSCGNAPGTVAGTSADQITKLNGESKKSEEKVLCPLDVSSADGIAKSDVSACKKIVPPKVKGKRVVDVSNVDKTSRVKSARHAKEEDGHVIVNSNGDASSGKSRKSQRKGMDLALGSESLANKVEPLAGSSTSNTLCHNSQEEDEENLEQNAAQMLSSRFDPTFKRVALESRSFASPRRNGVSFVVSPGDIAARTLRPRNHKGKGLFRKRRHFYEILSKDLDAHWVLNRRIKIFWPLDESWYYGLVNEYDPKRDLHHIKYDDRDEEWINLQNERFKLLVFPSEIPRKMETERGTTGNKHDDSRIRDSAADDDSFIGCHTDSEPIISWLARSSRKVKSSLLGVSKRRKTCHPSSNFLPLVLSANPNDANGCLDLGFSARHLRESSSSDMPDRSIDVSRAKKSMLEGSTISKDSKAPVVYFRRRFHKKGKVLPDEKKACGSSPCAPVSQGLLVPEVCEVLLGQMDPEGLFWSVNNLGLLNVTIGLVEYMGLRFELRSVSVLRYLGVDNSWLFRSMFLLYYGTLTITWPKIHLEMLFVDNFVGLRFLSFEGCLKQAMTLIFLILTAFYQPNGKYADVQIPVTSIRFKLSSFEDVTKQHAFAFFSFSKVRRSKWLFLDCELQSRCLLTKRLPVSECTYDNIKALEGGCNLMHESSIDGELSAFEDWRRKSTPRGITWGAFEEESMNQYSSNTAFKHGKFLPFSLSFSAAPTFFLRLHLKLLMENSVASISLRDHDMSYAHEHSDNTRSAMGCTLIQDCFKSVSQITQCDLETSESRRWLLYPKQHLGICGISEFNDSGLVKSSQDVQSGSLSAGETSACSRDPAENLCHVIVQSQRLGCSGVESEKHITTPEPLVGKDHVSVGVPDSSRYSSLTGLSVEIPFLDQNEMPSNGKTPNSGESSDLAWKASDATGCNPNPTGPKSIWHHNRESLNSSSRDASPSLANGRRDFICNGFGNGPKKPRTQVHYTLPSGVSESGAMHKIHAHRGVPYKRIRKASEKRTLHDSRNSHRRNLEFLACDANVLITIGDRGWREYGARIVLELVDHNEWRLAVKLTGTTKYSYKAHQFLQLGSTNRYTHAMMWKGGKDWVLEFPDRSQWILFKEMHEECYNRNMRAASVKNIPIPGVRLIEESDDIGTELPFVRCAPMYFQQVETDIDMAMDPLSVLYDMDSDDEQWISENQNSSCNHGSKCEEISEELFEKTMDAFEKVAYAEQRDHFTSDEMENFMGGVAPLEVVKLIYNHWRQKRQKKGMPLIRHLQPPLWERYEQQVKEWEHAMAKANSTHPNGCQDKASAMEKPPIYAFCLKPRGLEVPNKGSKQRSHKKFPASGHSHAFLGDHDGLHTFGRRSSGFALVDEKVMFQGNSRDSSDASPLFQPSRAFSPRGACGTGYFSLNNDYTDWNHPKLHSNRSKKIGTLLSPSLNSPQMLASYNQRTTISTRNGVHRWNMGSPEWSNQKHYALEGSLRPSIEHLDGPDLDEFRLRDASGAAHHALTMARLKREKAQRLLYRADLAIHKAVVALTAAEAIKASFSEDSNGIEEEDNMKLE